jgi:hypothetical protein
MYNFLIIIIIIIIIRSTMWAIKPVETYNPATLYKNLIK